jgi:hypothetical protein
MGLLANVKVTIKSPALMLPSMERLTNAEGVFRFSSISGGLYTVTFEMAGFKTIVRKNIVVNAGVTTSLDVILETSTIQETIEVSGKSPTVDRQSTTTVAVLDDNFLQLMPATRNLSEYFNMVPGVTGDTAHGSSVRDTTATRWWGPRLGDSAWISWMNSPCKPVG